MAKPRSSNDFWGIGNILPADIGPVTARIVQLSYAPADKACYLVYATVEKRHIEVEGDLSSFFVDQTEPDWGGIAETLLPHVQRPSEMKTRSADFKQWAARFIEVKLPAKMLEWGIDIYDTPGYLSGKREEVLMENLHALVKRIEPILLFLYENASISETERSCFLGMKEALNGLARVRIFFLATKVDCLSIANDYALNDDPDEVPLEAFQRALGKQRQRCYDLLRRRTEMASEVLGSLPTQVDQCSCFDIFTTGGEDDPWENHTNSIIRTSVRRIVLFAVESFSMPIRTVSRDMLAIVDNYFGLMRSTSQRTTEQWGNLGQEAADWGAKFFAEFSRLIPTLIDALLERIRVLLDEQREEIVQQAADLEQAGDQLDKLLQDKPKRIRDYIELAVQEKIIKVAANQVIIEKGNDVKKKMAIHFEQQRCVRRNELLEIAQRQILGEISSQALADRSRFNLLLDSVIKLPLVLGRFWRSLPTRWGAASKQKYNEITHGKNNTNEDEVHRLFSAMDADSTLSKKENRRLFAELHLNETGKSLQGQKLRFTSNLTEWIESQHQAFRVNIQKNYKYVGAHFPKPFALHEMLDRYSASFARIECQLLATLELAERKGPSSYSWRRARQRWFLQCPRGSMGIRTRSRRQETSHSVTRISRNDGIRSALSSCGV